MEQNNTKKRNRLSVLGGPAAEAYLDKLDKLAYQSPKGDKILGGYYMIPYIDTLWISFWVAPDGETFVEDFDNKLDAICYAQGIQVELTSGTWR